MQAASTSRPFAMRGWRVSIWRSSWQEVSITIDSHLWSLLVLEWIEGRREGTEMSVNRRQFIQRSAAVATAAGFGISRTLDDAQLRSAPRPGVPGTDYRPVVTPDG